MFDLTLKSSLKATRQTENLESTIRSFFTHFEKEILAKQKSVIDHNNLFKKIVVFGEENQKTVPSFARSWKEIDHENPK